MITDMQIRMARAALNWNVKKLSDMADVNPNTISRIENGHDSLNTTLEKIKTTFEKNGLTFIDGGVCLKKP